MQSSFVGNQSLSRQRFTSQGLFDGQPGVCSSDLVGRAYCDKGSSSCPPKPGPIPDSLEVNPSEPQTQQTCHSSAAASQFEIETQIPSTSSHVVLQAHQGQSSGRDDSAWRISEGVDHSRTDRSIQELKEAKGIPVNQ